MVQMQSSYFLIILIWFFCINDSKAQSSVFIGLGLSHNNIFKSPTLEVDTSFNVNGPSTGIYPAWSYFLTINSNQFLCKKPTLIFKYGFEYNYFHLTERVDSLTAVYYKKYFVDPEIERNYKSFSISTNLIVGYYLKKFTISSGLNVSFRGWNSSEIHSLSGEITEFSSEHYKLHGTWLVELCYRFCKNENIEIGFRYEYKNWEGFDLNYFKVGLSFQLFRFKK